MEEITKYAIYPPIGIARVGNSPDEWFIGPETPGSCNPPHGGYKDGSGRIKRQAARFRIYGLGPDGKAIQELTARDAKIRWTVHLSEMAKVF